MSVTLKFYIFTGDKRRVNKANYLTEETTITGDFTNTVCITNNTILIDLDKFYEIAEWDIQAYNYLYIQNFNRYYFIRNVYLINTKVAQITTIEDPLYSNWTKIRYSTFYIARNENTYNKYIKDDLISYYYDKNITDIIPSNGDLVNTTFDTDLPANKISVAITAIDDNSNYNADTTDAPTDSDLPSIIAWTAGSEITSRTYATLPGQLYNLSYWIVHNDTLASFIVSIIAFPFEIDTYGVVSSNLKLGDTSLTGDKAVLVAVPEPRIPTYRVVADFTYTGEFQDFRDYEPYSQYEIYIPYLGYIPISADKLLNNHIIVYYVVNYSSGQADVVIYNMTSKSVIHSSSCQLGVQIPPNTTTAWEVLNARNSNNIGLSVNLLSSMLSIGVGLASQNPFAVAGGVLNVGSSIARFAQNENQNVVRGQASVSSGQIGLYMPQKVSIRKTSYKFNSYNSDFFHLYGRPLNAFRQLDTLTGITKLNDVRLDTLKLQDDEESLLRRALDDYIIL